MPINFGSRITTALAAVNAATGATQFAAAVVDLLNSGLGADNEFGDAALLDTGTTEGDVPVLDAQGNLAGSTLPSSSSSIAGIITLATALTDSRPDVVPTAAQVAATVAALRASNTNPFNTATLNLVDMFPGVATSFTTPGPGFIIASGGGGGGAGGTYNAANDSDVAAEFSYTNDDDTGYDGSDFIIGYSGTSNLIARGGKGGVSDYENLSAERESLSIITIDTAAANRPEFAFRLKSSGAPGGIGREFTGWPTQPRNAGYQVKGGTGLSGELLIALVSGSGKAFTLGSSNGAGGRGAERGNTIAQNGKNGFCLFMKIG